MEHIVREVECASMETDRYCLQNTAIPNPSIRSDFKRLIHPLPGRNSEENKG